MTDSTKTFASRYCWLLQTLLGRCARQPWWEVNERTGVRVRAIVGFALHYDLSLGLPLCGVRHVNPGTAAAEAAWFLTGSQKQSDLNALGCYIWDEFADANGLLPGAYGYRWRHHFGTDQIANALRRLDRDPSSRQVYVTAWDPAVDGAEPPYDMSNRPCPLGFTLHRTPDGYLHSNYFMRSSDAFVGLPYDAMCHAFIVTVLANTLGLRPGEVTMQLSHVHLYEDHIEMACRAVEALVNMPRFPMPGHSLKDVLTAPMAFVEDVRWYFDKNKKAYTHPYNPKPRLVL